MVWQTRLREAAYTSPGGTRLTYLYERATEEYDQKGGAFQFASADGTYVQPLGVSSRRYPERIIVTGDNYDLEAEQWMNILGERGEGLLEHPVHGRKQVIPVGAIRRTEGIVEDANQAFIDVQFFVTTGLLYPNEQNDPTSQVVTAVAAADAAAAAQLAGAQYRATIVEQATFIDRLNSGLDTIRDNLQPIYDTVDTVQRQVEQVQDSINTAINVLVRDPIALAAQVQQLAALPARIVSQAGDRLDAYGNLVRQLTGSSDADNNPRPVRVLASSRADLYATDLVASSAAVSQALAVINTEYDNQPQAIDAAEQVLQTIDELSSWRDDSFEVTGEIDNGIAWQAAQAALALTAGAVIQIANDLRRERRVVLTSDRNIVELAYELYGSVDDRLNDLINDNALAGDAVIEIPRGTEVVYYE